MGFQDIGTRIFEFVAKTQFLSKGRIKEHCYSALYTRLLL